MNAIYLSELAQLYFPRSSARSAVTQLHRWIRRNAELTSTLQHLHYRKGQRALTPLQREAIVRALGAP